MKCAVDGCGSGTVKFSIHCAEHDDGKTKGANARQVGGQHYQMPIQPWDFITKNEIPYLEGTAIAYIVRHRRKHGKEDLEKAIHFLQKAIEVYYP